MSARWNRLVNLLLALTAAGCVALAAARTGYNISLHQPLQLVTSGAEEEALYSIWCTAHGQPIYTDPVAVPYTASYFNWLFYALYGSATAATLRVFHLGDAWLPTICRMLTLCLAVGGTAIFFLALRGLDRAADPRMHLLLAIIALFNPLSGLWLITARPDIGAATLELASLALYFRYLRTGGMRWIVLTALFLYAAWSFKQTALSALAGIGLTLVVLRDARGLTTVATIWLAGVLLALAALGPDYRHGLYLSQVHAGAHLRWGVEHFVTAVSKMPFIPVALIFLPWLLKNRNYGEPRDRIELTVAWTIVAALALEAATSCKGGAADYYFIPLAIWSVLGIAMAARRLPALTYAGALAAVCCVMIVGMTAVLAGWRGTLDCRDPRQPFEHLARYLAPRPGPVFVQSTYGDLPWISITVPHFVIAYLYAGDRTAGVPFERGGWENLLAKGYFSTVVTDVDTTGEEAIPPAQLEPYRFVREEAGFRYFERK